MCDWNEEDPHCHLNPVNSFGGALRKTGSMLSTLDTEQRSSCEVKNHIFGGAGGLRLDFTFHV